MGLLLAKLYQAVQMFQTGTPTRVLMLGLDAAGKTTILYKVGPILYLVFVNAVFSKLFL